VFVNGFGLSSSPILAGFRLFEVCSVAVLVCFNGFVGLFSVPIVGIVGVVYTIRGGVSLLCWCFFNGLWLCSEPVWGVFTLS